MSTESTGQDLAGAHRSEQEPTLEGAFDQDGIDLTVIRWMLALTPTERLRAAQDLIDAANVLRGGHGP